MAEVTQITLPAGFPKAPSTAKTATLDNYVSSIDLHKDDVWDELVYRYGNQRIQQDLFAVHGNMRPVAQTQFKHWEETFIFEHLEATAGAAAIGTDGSVTFTVAAGYLSPATTGNPAAGKTSVRVKDVIQVYPTNDLFVVQTVPTDNTFTAIPYKNWTADYDGAAFNMSIVGRENVERGSTPDEGLSPEVLEYTNNVMIMDDAYFVSGSEMTNQIWMNVKGVDGKSGYLWYYKGELDTRNRFESYCEIMGLVGQQAQTGGALAGAGFRGSRGYLEDLKTHSGTMDVDRTGGDSFGQNSFRTIAKHLNKYRGSRENAFYMGIDLYDEAERAVAADVGYYAGGQNFGAFNNSEDTMINLGFSGVKVLGHKFALKTYDLFNHPKLLGAPGSSYPFWGMVVPLDSLPDSKTGTMTPSLSVRYKEMDNYSRLMEHWPEGAVNGVYTNSKDELKLSYRSERALEGFALNRHFLVTGNAA